MKCVKCNSELPDGAQFCNACGSPQGAPNAQVPPPQYAQVPPPQYGQVPPQQYVQVQVVPQLPQRNKLVALLLCLFVGELGIHRFYVGKIGSGIVQLLTGGGCGIWWLIDLIMILTGSFRDNNGNPLA